LRYLLFFLFFEMCHQLFIEKYENEFSGRVQKSMDSEASSAGVDLDEAMDRLSAIREMEELEQGESASRCIDRGGNGICTRPCIFHP
jgi:hypothetical protein